MTIITIRAVNRDWWQWELLGGPDSLFYARAETMSTSKTKTYSVKRYNDGKTIGSVDLTPEQFSRYESIAQQPEGLVRLGAMPHDLYELDAEYQDTHEDTTVYLD